MRMTILLVALLCGNSYAQPVSGSPSKGSAKQRQESALIDGALIAADLYKYETPMNQKILEQISINQNALADEVGVDYAGTWVEYDENNGAHQIVAATRQINLKKNLQINGQIKILVVRNSLRHLNEIQEFLMKYMESTREEPLVLSSAIDVRSNKLLVRIRPGRERELDSIIVNNALDVGAISIEHQNGPVQLYRTLIGG